MKKKILNQSQVRKAIAKVAEGIVKQVKQPSSEWALVGIHRRGVPLAGRLSQSLSELGVSELPVGTLDITLYRDDMDEVAEHPVVHDTDIPFDINGRTIFLLDDVLFTGRTIRCALDQLMDYGRPQRVYLVVLVDRGHRELPICADFCGEAISTPVQKRVEVHLAEIDGEDAVWVTPVPSRVA